MPLLKAADPPPRESSARAGGRRTSERKVSSAVNGARKGRRNEISFCRLRSSGIHGVPRSDRASDDPAKFHSVRSRERLHLQKSRPELDLFFAPQLKDLSDWISPDVEFQLFDFSVLNKLSPGAKGTSEAIEFMCPPTALKQFVNAEITNQQLLDQSAILVNGVRIALDLQSLSSGT